jgi:hypothetical protein
MMMSDDGSATVSVGEASDAVVEPPVKAVEEVDVVWIFEVDE